MKPLHKEDIFLDYTLYVPVIPDFSINYLKLIFFTETTPSHIGMISKFRNDLKNAIDAPS